MDGRNREAHGNARSGMLSIKLVYIYIKTSIESKVEGLDTNKNINIFFILIYLLKIIKKKHRLILIKIIYFFKKIFYSLIIFKKIKLI